MQALKQSIEKAKSKRKQRPRSASEKRLVRFVNIPLFTLSFPQSLTTEKSARASVGFEHRWAALKGKPVVSSASLSALVNSRKARGARGRFDDNPCFCLTMR